MRYSNLPLTELIAYLLSQKKEGEFWDFKQEWHRNIEDLLKDIICFANTVHDEDCYIIFGVSNDFIPMEMKEPRRKQADVLDTISNCVFAGDNSPQISIRTVLYENIELDVLIIHNTNKTPIYLKKNYGKMMQGCVYARIGDRNTPDKGNADITIIEDLWRKRLGLTKPPLEYIFDTLDNKLDWVESENGYYHIYKPEYTIERSEKEEVHYGKGSDEFYSYAQTNETTSYYVMEVKAKGTTLERYQIVNLDSGRLSVPVPEWGFVHFDEYRQEFIGYKYYIKGSHIEKLLQFMYDSQNCEERWAFNNLEKVTLFFDTDGEKDSFEKYVESHRNELIKEIDSSDEYDYIVTENETKTDSYKKSLRTAVILKKMLAEFRKE